MEEKIRQMRAEWAKGDVKRDKDVLDPEGLIRHYDLRYGEYPENLLDVYYPEGTVGPLPTIISFHGGGWFYGSKKLYSHYCLRMAKRGFAVVNFDYRLAPEYKYPAPLEDCCGVLNWIRENGEKYHIDLKNLFMVGDSAGGQLAFQMLTLLTNQDYRKFFSFQVPEITINACALNCGCYFFPLSKFVTPAKMGTIFEAYLPEDYMSVVPSLKAHKYITRAFPPAYVMTSRYDYLRLMAPPLYAIMKFKGVVCKLRIYGKKGEKEIAHVFHLNCGLKLADQCNDEECAFFRKYLK